jgi:hypothetical protein
MDTPQLNPVGPSGMTKTGQLHLLYGEKSTIQMKINIGTVRAAVMVALKLK